MLLLILLLLLLAVMTHAMAVGISASFVVNTAAQWDRWYGLKHEFPYRLLLFFMLLMWLVLIRLFSGYSCSDP